MEPESVEIGEGPAKRAVILKRRFLACLPLGLVVMVLSMVPAWQFPGWQWVVAVATLPVVTWGAWPFHQAAFQAVRHGATTMDTLVSLGVSVSSLWSYGALFFGGAGEIGMTMSMSLIPRSMHGSHAHLYFEAATMIVVFLLGGRWAEARSRYRAGDALREILTLGAKEATILKYPGNSAGSHGDAGSYDGASSASNDSNNSNGNGGASNGSNRSDVPEPSSGTDAGNSGEPIEVTIPAAKLQVGDLMVVRAGEKIPTDGIVVKGTSAVDNSMLTGESMPEDVAPTDTVVGGAVNTWGLLHVRATRVGQETILAQIGRMVVQAQATKAPIQRLADQVSAVFVPIIIVLAIVTFGVWLALGHDWTTALTCAVAVLVVACPCALGLATPTALLVGSGRAAQLGIVIRNAEVLENTRRIDTVVLDKTGTVTTGQIQVDDILPLVSPDENQPPNQDSPNVSVEQNLLSLSAAVESGSQHPLAVAIRKRAQTDGLDIPVSTSFTNHPGGGVSAIVKDCSLWLGNLNWVASRGVRIPHSLRQAIETAEASGATVSVLVDAGKPQATEVESSIQATEVESSVLSEESESVQKSEFAQAECVETEVKSSVRSESTGVGTTGVGSAKVGVRTNDVYRTSLADANSAETGLTGANLVGSSLTGANPGGVSLTDINPAVTDPTGTNTGDTRFAGIGIDSAIGVSKIRVEMRVEGMTCAACVRRVEKKLSKLDGVTSTVNLATEIATIELDSNWDDAALEKVVNDAGYHGHVLRRELVAAPTPVAAQLGGLAEVKVIANTALAATSETGSDKSHECYKQPQSQSWLQSQQQIHPQIQSQTQSQSQPQPHAYVQSTSQGRLQPHSQTHAYIESQTNPQAQSPEQSQMEVAPAIDSLKNATVLGAIVLRDQVKTDAAQAISELEGMRIKPILLTGDNQSAANQVAKQIGVTQVVAQVKPDQKRQKIVELQQAGHQVAMVGDGINDAAALAQASAQGLSIAMGQGTDLAIAVADITLMRDTLTSVPQAIRLSRHTLNTIKGNLFWAFFYNVAMVPLAAFGLLNPMLASAAMACSSIFVVLNSLRLKTQK